ncbi:MAG: hypothetical protein EPN46_03025 [Candidimonas sp.]|nr:MAG: hypothetical protein EPN77_19055 [Candidimonas sp.]TAM20327.1 MAG: hypothetical protein EPN62_16885 [Candidimonas sp.]TAM79888.1 MAG: hypothetical protein EPN46_03025 [Candidimonas sp.]
MKRVHFCTMGAIRRASIGLVALFISTPGANAQEEFPTIKDKVSLVQNFQPVFRSYPGVSADSLGIRTGMTVSKAEAIAEKNYGTKSKPSVSHLSDTLIYDPGNFSIESRPFISYVSFSHWMGIMLDSLTLHFSSPVTGNTLLGMSRQISYYQSASIKTPSVSTIKTRLIKKYGPTSYQSKARDGGLIIGWIFGQKELFICKTHDCMGGHFTGVPNFFSSGSIPGKPNLLTQCGATASGPNIFRIDAKIDANKSAKAEIRDVTISIWDVSTCVNDATEAKKQLTAAAIKYDKATYKPAAGPEL